MFRIINFAGVFIVCQILGLTRIGFGFELKKGSAQITTSAGEQYYGRIDVVTDKGIYLISEDGRYLPFFIHEIKDILYLEKAPRTKEEKGGPVNARIPSTDAGANQPTQKKMLGGESSSRGTNPSAEGSGIKTGTATSTAMPAKADVSVPRDQAVSSPPTNKVILVKSETKKSDPPKKELLFRSSLQEIEFDFENESTGKESMDKNPSENSTTKK